MLASVNLVKDFNGDSYLRNKKVYVNFANNFPEV